MFKKKQNKSIAVPVKKKKMTKTRIAFILFACLPPVIDWLIHYVYANAASFGLAFTGSKGQFSLENFVRLWEELKTPDSSIMVAIRNTLITFGLDLLTFPLYPLISYFIYKKIPGASLYRVLFFLPRIIFSVALAFIVTRILGVNGFVAEAVQNLFHLDSRPELLADSRYANATVLLHMLWMGFPGDLIIWGGAFARIPVELLESGRIDGTNWWKEFTHIIVPLMWPTIALKMVLSFARIFSSSAQVFLLTGGEFGTMTLQSWMYIELLSGSGSPNPHAFNYMSAVGLCMTVIAVALSLITRNITDKVFDEVEY